MNRIPGVVVRGQGETFVVVSVEKAVLDSLNDRKDALAWRRISLAIPAVLVARRDNRTGLFGGTEPTCTLSTRDLATPP